MSGAILPRRDGEFRLKYDSEPCKRVVENVGDMRVPVYARKFVAPLWF